MDATIAQRPSTGPAGYNPLLPEFRENPYPSLHRLRQQDPVHWSPVFQFWVLTRYADAVAALRDSRLSCSPTHWHNYQKHLLRGAEAPPMQAQVFGRFMLQIDPPDHTRLRALVSRAFTPRVVEAIRPKIQAIVDELLDRLMDRGTMDVVSDFAYPLPIKVIGQMLGCPDADHERIKQWSADLVPAFGPAVSGPHLEHINRVATQFSEYFTDLIAQRRKCPGDTLLDGLIAARDGANKLSDEELVSTCILLVAAGHLTTVQLIAKGLLALLNHPDQFDLLQRRPELGASAVEEMLRFDSPLQVVSRTALEDLVLGGKTIRKGQMVIVSFLAANRDPEQFPEPDRFDIARSPNRHIAFGYGDHFCAGAPLARLEARVAMETILRRLPGLELSGEPVEHDRSLLLRGLKSLPVRFAAGGAKC